MPLYFTYEVISQMSVFSFIDFATFTSYEQLMTTIVFNILFYLFLIFFCSVVYKTICRLVSFIF